MVSMRLWIFTIVLLTLLTGGVYGYIQYINSKSLYEASTLSTSTQSLEPLVEVVPSTPSVGDSVMVYIKLVYLGSNRVYVNPFELRTKYIINLTIIDLERESIYLSRSLGYKEASLNERTIMVKPGDSIGIGYAEVVFLKPGRYAIKAYIDGPELTTNEATVELEVKPEAVRISYESTTRVDDWILALRVKPEKPTTHDNLTLEVSLMYAGSDKFKIRVSVPLIKMIKMIHIEGIDSWSIAIPSHISGIDVEPGYNQSFKFTVGPEAPFPHKFTQGVYKVEVYAIGYTPKGYPIDTTITLFIRIEGG